MKKTKHPELLKLVDSGIDLSALGLELCDMTEDERYFCTPARAEVFGRVGVDGIHFCFAGGHGDMVFCVCPMDLAPRYVRPVARSFADFLSLLVSCGDTSVIESAWRYDRETFEGERGAAMSGSGNEAARAELREKLGVLPMADPYDYIRSLQADFDYSEFDMPVDEPARKPKAWKVYFDKGLYAPASRGRAGEEIRVGRSVTLNGDEWRIPSIYVCPRGFVVDILHIVDNAKYAEFYDGNCFLVQYGDDIPEGERRRIESENPLNVDPNAALIVNGKTLVGSGGTSCVYDPVPEHGETEDTALAVKEHYSLDEAHTVVIWRLNFAGKFRADEISSAEIVMTADMKLVRSIPVGAGGATEFEFPEGERHTLRISEVTPVDIGDVVSGGMRLPRYMTSVAYRIEPDLPREVCRLCDYNRSDIPMNDAAGGSDSHAAIGIIGGADGPTVVLGGAVVKGTDESCRGVSSSLSFDRNRVPDWHLELYSRPFEGVRIPLI